MGQDMCAARVQHREELVQIEECNPIETLPVTLYAQRVGSPLRRIVCSAFNVQKVCGKFLF